MKKYWIIALIIAIGIGTWVFIANKVEEQNEKMFMEDLLEQATLLCAEEAEKILQKSYIQVNAIDFDIKQISPVIDGRRYVIYVDWYVDAEVYASTKADREYWMTMVSGTMENLVTVDGKSITLTYMKDNFNEGCNLIYNNGAAMNGYDYHKHLTGKDENAYTGYSEVSCPVCGERFRSNSSYGLRAKKGGPCGFQGCGK